MHDDMIDFPCSYDWLDHYHKRGLTPYGSGRGDPDLKRLYHEIRETQHTIQELLETLIDLVSSLQKGSNNARKDDGDEEAGMKWLRR